MDKPIRKYDSEDKRQELTKTVLRLYCASESPGRPLKTDIAGPYPKVAASGSLDWGLRIYISHKFSADADHCQSGVPTLRNTNLEGEKDLQGISPPPEVSSSFQGPDSQPVHFLTRVQETLRHLPSIRTSHL